MIAVVDQPYLDSNCIHQGSSVVAVVQLARGDDLLATLMVSMGMMNWGMDVVGLL